MSRSERLQAKMTILTLRCPETGETFTMSRAELASFDNADDEGYVPCPCCGSWHDDFEIVREEKPEAPDAHLEADYEDRNGCGLDD